MAEYRAYCAGELSALCKITEAPGGRVEYCGVDEDPAHWAICYVRASNRAVVPLAVGQEQRVFAEFDALDRRCAPVWDPLLMPGPVALIDGHKYPFKAARGRHLLGVVQLERQAVLLAAADDRLVAVLLADGATTLLPLGRPLAVREIDVDLMRRLWRPRAVATPKPHDAPLEPSPRTRSHHTRMVHGRPIELGGGLTLTELLAAAFNDIEARATTPRRRTPRKRGAQPVTPTKRAPPLKGKTWVPLVLTYLRKLALQGCRDLVGLVSEIIKKIQAHFPRFEITTEAFADALRLIAATGTCLIAPREAGDRIWHIKLAGLCDPTSAIHRRLCRETSSRILHVAAAANEQGPQVDGAPAATTRPTPRDAREGDGCNANEDLTPREASHASITGAAPARGIATPEGPPANHSAPDTGPARAERPNAPAPDVGCSATDASSDVGAARPPATSADTQSPAQVLDLIEQLGKNPLAGPMFLLYCQLAMSLESLSIDDDAANDHDAPRPADGMVATAEVQLHVDDDMVNDRAVQLAATAAPAGHLDAVMDSAASPDDDSIQNADEVDARPFAWVCAMGSWTPRSSPCLTLPGLRRGAALPRHQALTPVQPEPRRRDLGTLGPRGPPVATGGGPSRLTRAAGRAAEAEGGPSRRDAGRLCCS